MFDIMEHSEQESSGPRSLPDFSKESQRFRVELRKTCFLNPSKNDSVFKGLDGNTELSNAMKTFSSTAHVHRQNFIKKKLTSDKSPNARPIPVTVEEEEKQSAISSMSNNDLICVIQTLIESLNEANRPQFKGLKSKRKDELLQIFQQVQDLHNGNDETEAE